MARKGSSTILSGLCCYRSGRPVPPFLTPATFQVRKLSSLWMGPGTGQFASNWTILSPARPLTLCRDYPSEEGYPERSEFTIVKVDFYNELRKYLGALVANPKEITSLEDVMDYNIRHTSVEGGVPRTHPAWPTGQDSFEQSADSMGTEDGVYHSALNYTRRSSREEGIDKALRTDGEMLDGLLVPIQADDGVAMQIAAKAGRKTLHYLFARFTMVLTQQATP